MISSERVSLRRDVISICNLYSGALFLVPCVLLHMHGFRLLAVQTASVCGMSLVYHRQCIATGFKCNPVLRVLDVINSALACASVLWFKWNDVVAFLFMLGVPVFWLIEHALMARGHFSGSLCGVCGLHSLCHLCAIAACCRVAGPTGDDIYPAALACIAALTAASLVEPEFFQPIATMEERRLAWTGVRARR